MKYIVVLKETKKKRKINEDDDYDDTKSVCERILAWQTGGGRNGLGLFTAIDISLKVVVSVF